jgi:hypothetical protein
VRHVLEHFIVKEGAKGGGSLRIARRAYAALATRKTEQELVLAVLATKPSETCFWSATVEVTGYDEDDAQGVHIGSLVDRL